MKNKFLAAFAIATLAVSAPALAQKGGKTYGKALKATSVQTPESVTKAMADKTSMNNVAIRGEVSQVCQAEGCWLKLKNNGGDDLFVKMKGHAFFVPKDIAGKTAVIYGNVMKKTVSVAEQKHLAEDAGTAQAEIDAITTPKDEMRIEATGVTVM